MPRNDSVETDPTIFLPSRKFVPVERKDMAKAVRKLLQSCTMQELSQKIDRSVRWIKALLKEFPES